MNAVKVQMYNCMLLCSGAEVSAAALQEMNPLVKVTVQAGSADVEDLSFVASYQVRNLHLQCHVESCRPRY